MAKKQKLSPGREMALNVLFDNYDIKTAADLQDALKDLFGDGIKKMLEAEMDEHLGYEKGQVNGSTNYRNGHKSKKIRSHNGEIELYRPLDDVYPIVFIDAVHFSVRHEKVIKKLAAYVILGIRKDGKKEVLGLYVGENESSKYWLGVLNELKNRGVKDILIMCADGLTGIKESIQIAFPNTEYQRCIVHQVRNTLRYVSHKEKKSFAGDLKSIYTAPTEEVGYERLQEVKTKWQKRYPNSMKSWETN